ncbi:MAG: transposase [Lewinellaceae bacterium]|nr:transposase [Lewinellaceae bacterium]
MISLGGDQSIRKIVQLIKGESSNWINQSGRLSGRFSWQKEFFASSVSVSRLPVVRKYLYDQEVHHQRISFQDEYREFIREAGFQDPTVMHE